MKIFVLLPRFPFPLEKGDKLRAYNQIKFLSENNEIHLCALSETRPKKPHLQALDPFCESITVIRLSRFSILINVIIAFFTGKPLQVGYFFNEGAHLKIKRMINHIQPDHIYCQLIRVAEYVKNQPVAKTLDYQDVFSKGVERRIKRSPFFLKPLLRFEYRRLLKYEQMIFDYFDNKTIISIPDRDFIPHPEKKEIQIIINGVDTDYFKPIATKKQYDLVFTGNMGYPPNIDAAGYLAKEILPEVHKKKPGVKLTFAGANPHKKVLAYKSENINVTGWMQDIRLSYARAKIFIAPMRIGTGLQNKLLEAMAMKIPTITSPLANNALEAKHGEEILIGETTEEFVQNILNLLEDETLSTKIAENAYRFVHEKYNWTAATSKLEKIMENT